MKCEATANGADMDSIDTNRDKRRKERTCCRNGFTNSAIVAIGDGVVMVGLCENRDQRANFLYSRRNLVGSFFVRAPLGCSVTCGFKRGLELRSRKLNFSTPQVNSVRLNLALLSSVDTPHGTSESDNGR